MVLVDDKETVLLNMQKHSLIRRFDRKEIMQEEYDTQMASILDKLKEKTKTFLEIKKESKVEAPIEVEVGNKIMEELEKMPDEKEEVQETKSVRKPVKNSKASFIAKALQMKTVKTFDDVAEKVLEWKPDADKEKIKAFAKSIIRQVKKGAQPRWQKYTWDEENFQLNEV